MKNYVDIVYSQLCDRIGRLSRYILRNKIERRKLKNDNFTIFSQNCIGGIMYHDLGKQFKSPTVNMLFEPKDFVAFMKNINWHLEQPIEFVKNDEKYPVGTVGNIKIKFLHYHSQQEVLRAWNERKQRINWDNVFVVSCDKGLNFEDMKEFDNLPYKNKILFMSKPNSEIKCGVYCKDFIYGTDARLLNFENLLGRRYYQKYIDYVKWLNDEEFRI